MPIEYATVPSTIRSFLPLTVTVWFVFQFAEVKVRVVVLVISPSVASLQVNVKETSSVGCEFSFMVKVAVARFSDVGLLIADTVTPATSLSILVTYTSSGFTSLYPESGSVEALLVI